MMVLDRKKVTKKKSKTVGEPHESDNLSRTKRSSNGVEAIKSRIKEIGPICKSRKKYERKEEDDEGFKTLFSQVNQQESVWLASESLSPLYKNGDFMFMSPREYPIDEQLISVISSYKGINSLTVKEDDFESSTTSLSKCSQSSSLFWDSDRTDLWVSLINLDGEDCKWISNFDSDTENLESNFPSPTYANKSCSDLNSSDVDVSSSMKSSFHDELSSELLSGSLDLDDVDFDEPLMWPFDDKYDWRSYTSEVFCQSPRRGFGSITSSVLKNDDRRFVVASKFVGFKHGNHRIVIASRNTKANRSSSSRNWMKLMVSTSKCSKKRFRKGNNLVMSAKRIRAMSLAGIDEFSSRSSSMDSSTTTTKSSSHSSSSSMDFDTAGLWVSLINIDEEDSQWISDRETDWDEGLESNFPSPSYKNRINQVFRSSQTGVSFRDELSVEIFSDEMNADEPLFWPYGKEQNWSFAWDSFCASPRRDEHHVFGNSVSIRVRIHDQRAGFKRSTGLSASKINGFKRRYDKKGSARKAKAMESRFGRSVARKHNRNVAAKMDAIMENDVEGATVEKILGLDEFDGHEGLDMAFRTDNFSILNE